MHSVGRTAEPGEPVRGVVAQAEPGTTMAPIGNRAVTALMTAPAPVAPIVIARPASASMSLDDPGFNPTTRAHDLLRAVDSEQYTYAMKSSGGLWGGMTEDVEAERRKIDFPAVVTALDGLTASQVKRVEEVFFEFEKKTTLRDDLFGMGQSGRRADLKPDQVARLQALLAGTKAEPIPPDVMAELRKYPPEVAGPLKADLEKRADAAPALHRHQAEAAELHQLLASDLDEGRQERLMAMHRRSFEEIDAVDAIYAKEYGPAALMLDLNKRLEGLQRMRMSELRSGKFPQADACAIEDKRRRIEELNKQDSKFDDLLPGGLAVGYDVMREQRKKEKQRLTGDIQAIIELNKKEALAEEASSGKAAGDAVGERLRAILGQQHGEVGNTLMDELGRTLAKEDAAVLTAAIDPWNNHTSNLVRAAAAQLVADEKAGTTSAKKIIETLKGFRGLAQHDLTLQAYDPNIPAEQKQAIMRDGESAITRLAQRYVDEYKAEYTKLAGEKGRGYDEIMESSDDADERYISNLSYGGGRTSDLGELEHAVGKKDVDTVKSLLRKQPTREKVDELIEAYNKQGDGHDLRRELFGADQLGRTATPELAQLGSSMFVQGGLVSGRDAAQVAEQLIKPSAADKGEGEARWIVKGGMTEYGVTMDHRGVTGRLREIGDDPETQRLLERTRNDLAALGRQFETEKNPAKRERLVAEMRRLRSTLTGDADAYEKDNERVLGEIRSALSFAVSIALAVLIPGAGAGVVAFLQTTALNIAANVASNFVIKMGDYSLDDLKADVLGGALGAGGAKFGEELMGRVAAAVMRPAAEATAETAGKLGVQTALAREVGAIAGAGEKTVIAATEFEIKTAATVASKSIVETGAREVGGFFGGIYAPKIMTGDYGLTVEEVLKALAATAAGKAAHRNKPGTVEEEAHGKPTEEAPGKRGEEEAQGKRSEEEAAPKPTEETALPVRGEFVPEPAPPSSDAFGPRTNKEMLLDSGIPPASAKGFQDVADVFNVVLKVRPTNTASLPVLEAGGVAKPELIKAKTVNRVDQLIGAPADGLGKVGFFEPRLPSEPILEALKPDARKAVQERYQQRLEEYNHYKDEYGKLAEQGLLRMKDGVLQIADPRSGEFRDIGGDHDIFEITNADGTPLNHDVRRALINQMRSMGINVEHPDHVSWPVDSPQTHDTAADQKIRKQHETEEPLVAFVPRSQPRQVMANDVVTGPPRTEGPGDRFMPAKSGQVTEPGPVGPGNTGESRRPGETGETQKATADELTGTREREPVAMRPAGSRNRSQGGPADALNTRIAGRLLEVRAEWAHLPHQVRAERLVVAIAFEIQNTGCPMPRVRMIAGENSYFHPDSWLIEIGRPAMTTDNPSAAEFAEICDHIRHEWEHAILEFRVARREARITGEDMHELADRLGMDVGATQRALEANAAPPGHFEAIDGLLDAQAALINQSLRGAGERERKTILNQLTKAERALARAREKSGPGASEAIDRALEKYNDAHEKYMNLPDEMQAWDVGRQVQEVVRKHHDLAADMAAAHKELTVRDAAVEEALAAGHAGEDLDRLQEAVERAGNRLDQLVRTLARRTGRNP
ncbi:hypothetical protein ACIA5D_39685 [Actinoplanes sp. NPDC051513]|uniref:hypothetical protein n=1 Tax=Actinoplanes sp. NPDC051513 TaxID=3363908 RepID=UPI00378AB2D5